MSRSAYDLDLMPPDDWRKRAACRGQDPQLWDVVGTVLSLDNERAMDICETCPVRSECDAWASGVEWDSNIVAGKWRKGHVSLRYVAGVR